MSVIKTSSKGIGYAKECILKNKSRVISKAVLMSIPHNHLERTDITLKLGRYTLPSEKVETQMPKSELTLDNDELNNLITYISENYKPVSLGSGNYINVSEEQEELIDKVKELINNNDDAANILLSSGILSDSIFIAASSLKQIDALNEFEDKLEDNLPESFWQNWFSMNKWILGSDFAHIIDERSIDTDNIADYLMRAFDGFVDLVEIKKPNGLLFWSTTKDHDNYVPSSSLIKAITQSLNYIHAIEQEANSAKFQERAKSKVIKPRCILVFGRSNDWNDKQKEAYRILNAAYNQLTILTYDHLLFRAKNVLGLLENDQSVKK